MRTLLAPVAAALLVALTASASLVEETTGDQVHYQFDADTFEDAPDSCFDSDPVWSFPVGNETDGWLVAGDDEADYIAFEVTPAMVGTKLQVNMAEQSASFDLDLAVWVPDCDGDVFAPQNQPSAPPNPPSPGVGQKQATLSNNGPTPGWTCDATKWFFVINQLGAAAAPASIHVVWTDGKQETVPVLAATPATNAHYKTTTNLGVTIKEAYANVPATWTGNFNIGAGPCDAKDGKAVFGDPPIQGNDTVTFTPTEPGYHVAGITRPPAEPPTVPTSVPLNCHFCANPFTANTAQTLGYVLQSTSL